MEILGLIGLKSKSLDRAYNDASTYSNETPTRYSLLFLQPTNSESDFDTQKIEVVRFCHITAIFFQMTFAIRDIVPGVTLMTSDSLVLVKNMQMTS